MIDVRYAVVAAASFLILAAPLSTAACAQYPGGVRERPAHLDTSLEQKSAHGTYEVRVEPLDKPVKAHRLQSWALTLWHDGKPVDGALIDFSGGMPEHGHGYPTKPRVEPVSDGRYVVRGVKFSMRGWWEMKFAIRTPQGADNVTFNLVI